MPGAAAAAGHGDEVLHVRAASADDIAGEDDVHRGVRIDRAVLVNGLGRDPREPSDRLLAETDAGDGASRLQDRTVAGEDAWLIGNREAAEIGVFLAIIALATCHPSNAALMMPPA